MFCLCKNDSFKRFSYAPESGQQRRLRSNWQWSKVILVTRLVLWRKETLLKWDGYSSFVLVFTQWQCFAELTKSLKSFSKSDNNAKRPLWIGVNFDLLFWHNVRAFLDVGSLQQMCFKCISILISQSNFPFVPLTKARSN